MSEAIEIEDAWTAVRSGLHYVSWLAKDFLHTGIAREDLEAEGRLGLYQAALRFEASHGVRFLTYGSWWARRRMQTFVARQGRVVRRPASRRRGLEDVSFDDPVAAGGTLLWRDVIADDRAPRAVDRIVGEEDRGIVVRAAAELPPLWRAILVRRFGLDGAPPMTLAAIGESLRLSRERVRQIESKAMGRLRARLSEANAIPARSPRPPRDLR